MKVIKGSGRSESSSLCLCGTVQVKFLILPDKSLTERKKWELAEAAGRMPPCGLCYIEGCD